jgi:hypothetical protein
MRTNEGNSARGGVWAALVGKEQSWVCFGGGEDAAGVHTTGSFALHRGSRQVEQN